MKYHSGGWERYGSGIPAMRGIGRFGYDEPPPPAIVDRSPIYETAKVTEGGGKWVPSNIDQQGLTYVGTWTPDSVTLARAAEDPAYAARLRTSGAKVPATGNRAMAVMAAVSIGIGLLALLKGRTR